MNNFQGEESTSNSHGGQAFEGRARKVLAEHGLQLEPDHKAPCSLGSVRKNNAFDLGSGSPRAVAECNSHTWTFGGNVPSAKMKNWAEAMFHLHPAPPDYRKIFVVERSLRPSRPESLLADFLRMQADMIPPDVELRELDDYELIVHEIRA